MSQVTPSDAGHVLRSATFPSAAWIFSILTSNRYANLSVASRAPPRVEHGSPVVAPNWYAIWARHCQRHDSTTHGPLFPAMPAQPIWSPCWSCIGVKVARDHDGVARSKLERVLLKFGQVVPPIVPPVRVQARIVDVDLSAQQLYFYVQPTSASRGA